MKFRISRTGPLFALVALSAAAASSSCSTNDPVGTGGSTAAGGTGSGAGGVGTGGAGPLTGGAGPGTGGGVITGGASSGVGGSAAGGSGVGGSGATGSGGDGSGGAGTGGTASVGHRTCDGSPFPEVKLTKIMEEPGTPTFVTSPPNDPSRIFVTYLNGTLRILSSGNVVTAGNFPVAQDFGEQGFFSIAFHPKFDAATEKRVYLFFNETTGHSRIVETTLDGDTLDTSDFETKTIIYQEQPNQNHNGGQLQFGPDGYLYAGFGDGGNQCDEHGAGGFFPIVTMPNNQAINLQSKLGSILRIDVDNIDALPAGNIDAGGGNDGQILHYGLRNPWRFSFDRGTNDLWIADVGQNAYEELNVLPAGSDGSVGPSTNFGWPGKEGTHDSSSSNCSQAPDPDPSAMDPIHDYGRGDGTSITGGYVYRGAAIPEMQGRYIFADYGSKNIWSITWDGTQACDFEDIADAFDGGGVLSGITSFGEDASGELYVAATSGVFKVEPK